MNLDERKKSQRLLNVYPIIESPLGHVGSDEKRKFCMNVGLINLEESCWNWRIVSSIKVITLIYFLNLLKLIS